jgi:hypothetical protein
MKVWSGVEMTEAIATGGFSELRNVKLSAVTGRLDADLDSL